MLPKKTLKKRDVVLVHSSLTSIGHVEGGSTLRGHWLKRQIGNVFFYGKRTFYCIYKEGVSANRISPCSLPFTKKILKIFAISFSSQNL